MTARDLSPTDMYLITLRLIQPARLQDIILAYCDIWAVEMTSSLEAVLSAVHDKMRSDGLLTDVRRGTYLLDERGMTITNRLIKERTLDNARMFLMKQQRKKYHRFAGRHG